MFLKHFPTAVVLPPKVHYYQPKLFGFQVCGKRGSKFYGCTEQQLVQQFKAKFTL